LTTLVPFAPNNSATPPWSSTITLDGNLFTLAVTWNLFGQRWFINLYDLSGNLIVTKAMIGSPDGVTAESLSWDFGVATAVTSVPHKFAIGTEVEVTISGCAPDAYNGSVLAAVIDSVTLSYQLASNPGPATGIGTVQFLVDMLAGYFDSILAYSDSAKNFITIP
jgi:hypothetical protein